ncbi:MAG: 1-phosphofructokinase family hexose kinase [Clostridia bacterium]|nr:1-phosphofructokinase family hexose kinase [Clostridia bacterium]
MLYALSLNPSLDKTASIDRFDPDAPNRVRVERLDVGGKGVNVARAANALGGDVKLIGFDYRGQPVASAMAKEKVSCALIPLAGDLRVNMKLREEETGRTLEIGERGMETSREDIRRITARLLDSVQPGDWVALAGSLPPGALPETYAKICRALKEKGCRIAVDCDGPALTAAMEEQPSLIKPNAQEFFHLTGVNAKDTAAATAACLGLVKKGVEWVCLSRGAMGALLAHGDDVWSCPAASVPVKGTAGAGDSMLAALLLAIARQMPPEDALRYAAAVAGASVMRPGTLLCRGEDVEKLMADLRPEKLEK